VVTKETELRPTNRRLEGFSDAVFAIVITITVITVRIPDSLAFADDPEAVRRFAVELLTYALSFVVIANLWTSHHYLAFTLDMPARATIWLNNHLLFWVTMIPIVTYFLGRYPGSPRACAAYGIVGVGITGAFMLLRSHAARTTPNELHRAIHHRVLRWTWLFVTIYAASIPLAFVRPWLAWACFLIVPPMFFLPIIRARMASESMPRERPDLEHSCP
jgi:uncharacterized membrane protein